MAKIKTSAQLRSFVADAMQSVLDDELEIEKARTITKMAAQINQSLTAELKVMKVKIDAGQEMGTLGDLEIT